MFKHTARLAALVALTSTGSLMIAGSAYAQDSAPMTVTAEVTANCEISTSPLVFGSYDPAIANATAQLDGTATVTVTCTNGFLTGITLDQGENPDTVGGSSDDVPLRQMVDGANSLSYFLYQDLGGEDVWGGTAASDAPHTGTGLPVALTVYGQMPGAQNVPVGSYSDIVSATVLF